MSFKEVFEWEDFKDIERSWKIRRQRWQIIHDNMTPWQYYKWDKQDLYNMINFDKVYIEAWYKWNINNLFDKLYGRLLKWWVISEPDPWDERNKRIELQQREEKWLVAKVLSFWKKR